MNAASQFYLLVICSTFSTLFAMQIPLSHLILAVENQNLGRVQQLLDPKSFYYRPLKINSINTIGYGYSPKTVLNSLFWHRITAEEPALSILNLLLANSADPNLQDHFGSTPLMKIARASDISIPFDIQKKFIRILIERGANVNLKSYNNLGPGSKHNRKTALESALIENKPEIAQYIQDVAQANGQTPLEINEEEIEKIRDARYYSDPHYYRQ